MQPTENSESNRTAEVEPAIRLTASWRVRAVAPLADFGWREFLWMGRRGKSICARF
jgi:hypothetical protein